MRYKELENILKCPISHGDMEWLSQDALASLNQQIQNHTLYTAAGLFKQGPIEAAFKVKDRDLYYPIFNDIIYLLPDLALSHDPSFLQAKQIADATKQTVREFYDEFGWMQEAGVFQDAKDSEDLRTVSQAYIENCHLRVNQFLPQQGKYLLDIASGPIQYDAYLSYSEQFTYRICGDISLKALLAARQKLGDKGIYLLCDVTQLPLKSQSMDAIVSLHTLYHVPKEQQGQAFAELYRALKPEGVSVIVYSWGGHSILMKCLMLPQKILSRLKRMLLSAATGQSLYFYAHTYQWYVQELKAKYQTQLYSWRSVNVPFLKTYVHRFLGGKQLLDAIFALENTHPELMGRIGAYPLLVTRKSKTI